jgi:hypothetical protein
MKIRLFGRSLGLVGASALFLSGCCTGKHTQLEQVAKDWCMTIRASQVIPVYPLTEDIQPGDIFLVQVPVDKQQKLYEQKGFLPLDNHIARLEPDGYANFYACSFFPSNGRITLPRDWARPEGVGIYMGTNGSNTKSWASAPRAAFPSYGFTVNSGEGLSLAVPVQGVPVGLSLLASDAASGSIQIQDARTMGVDTISLYRQLKTWAATNADFLHYFGSSPSDQEANFLRVVTRVYASGRMVISLKDASNRSGGLDVGVPKPVNLLQPELPKGVTNTPEAALQNFTNAWSAISQMVSAAGTAVNKAGQVLPGGSLRLAAASARSVSLDETFDPPIILGYLGFDCAVYRGGILGPPIPTRCVLDMNYNLGQLLAISPTYGQMLTLALYGLIREDTQNLAAQAVMRELDALEAYVPDQFTTYNPTRTSPTNFLLTATVVPKGTLSGFRAYQQFQTSLQDSVKALQTALTLSGFRFKPDLHSSDEQPVAANSPLRQKLQQKLDYYQNLLQHDLEDPKVQQAATDAYGYFLTHLSQ